jgi:hypothetical protein
LSCSLATQVTPRTDGSVSTTALLSKASGAAE